MVDDHQSIYVAILEDFSLRNDPVLVYVEKVQIRPIQDPIDDTGCCYQSHGIVNINPMLCDDGTLVDTLDQWWTHLVRDLQRHRICFLRSGSSIPTALKSWF